MNSNLQAKDIMTTNPLVLNADMPIELAIDLLTAKNIPAAPAVNEKGHLVGFLSVHDVMVELWCQDYLPIKDQKVADLMKRKVISVDVNEPLVNIVEFLCLDKEQLYPVSSMGIGTLCSITSISVEERAKKMDISKPQIVPVLNNGVLTGVIYRMEVMKALRPIYGENIDVFENVHELESA